MDNFDTDIMLKFLLRNYPVHRVKDNMRFKRAIVLDNGSSYLLSDQTSHIQVRSELTKVLKTVFYCDDTSSKTVLKTFLNLK
jgi:hypothetical protein